MPKIFNTEPSGNVKMQIENWFSQNYQLGLDLGYPFCCVIEFCNLPPEVMKTRTPTKDDLMKFEVSNINGQFTGFIPCYSHARMIKDGKTKLTDLITERRKTNEFGAFPNFNQKNK